MNSLAIKNINFRKRLLLSVALVSILLTGCQSQSKHYQTSIDRTKLPNSQLMQLADRTFYRELDRLDRYCLKVTDINGQLKSNSENQKYNDQICMQNRNIYVGSMRDDSKKVDRIYVLLNSRNSLTANRMASNKRDSYIQSNSTVDSQLNELYKKDGRVDEMLYEWSRVNRELSAIENIDTCHQISSIPQNQPAQYWHEHQKNNAWIVNSPIVNTSCDQWTLNKSSTSNQTN